MSNATATLTRETSLVLGRELKPVLRDPFSVVFSMIQPLFFLALFTSLVSAHTHMDVKVIYVLAMSLMLFAWFALVSVFFTTPSIRQGFFRFGRWFNRVTGITFILLAVRVAIAQQH